MKINITREQCEAVVIEIKRRHEADAMDAYKYNYDLPRELLLGKQQGMWGTLMAISKNWPDVVRWLYEIWEEQGMDIYNEDYHATKDECPPKVELKCEDCAYHWMEETEDRPTCHWTARAPGEVAPCDE